MIRQPTDRRLRRGSFLLAIIGVLTCVILLTIGYLRHAAMQARLSHRQGSQRVMASVAQGLATLAIHKLQYGPMYGAAAPVPDPSLPLGALYQALSAPLEAMPAYCTNYKIGF